MDSDSEHFESADEDLSTDEEIKTKEVSNILEVKNISIGDNQENSNKICKLEKQIDQSSNDANPVPEKTTEEQPQKLRRERQTKTKENKPKLGTKLGTKISDNFWDTYAEAKKKEYADLPKKVTCCEKPNLYSEISSTEENSWQNEENYMELPPNEKKKEETNNSWSNWGSWGVSSLLSTAQMGVTTITSSVSQGLSTVLESGLGVLDPEELARLDTLIKEQAKKEQAKKELKSDEECKEIQQQQSRGFGLGNLVKLVESTGTKVITGGLDTLEVIGKKTLEVLQEGDPGLKKKRALFNLQNEPVLSQILREAKQKAEEEDKCIKQIRRKPHFEAIFDDYTGLVHLEALEMLSKQCDIKIETHLEILCNEELYELQETLSQIKELCEIPDEDEETMEFDVVQEQIKNAIKEINITINYGQFLQTWSEIQNWLKTKSKIAKEVHEKAIDTLAKLTSIAVEQFHKAAEILLVKSRRSTVDEADSLVQLTTIVMAVLGNVAKDFAEKLNEFSDPNTQELITNVYFEGSNSSSYVKSAFNLMIPILQVGAIYKND